MQIIELALVPYVTVTRKKWMCVVLFPGHSVIFTKLEGPQASSPTLFLPLLLILKYYLALHRGLHTTVHLLQAYFRRE